MAILMMKINKKLIRKEIISNVLLSCLNIKFISTLLGIDVRSSGRKVKKEEKEMKCSRVLKLDYCFLNHETAFSLKYFNYPDNKRTATLVSLLSIES